MAIQNLIYDFEDQSISDAILPIMLTFKYITRFGVEHLLENNEFQEPSLANAPTGYENGADLLFNMYSHVNKENIMDFLSRSLLIHRMLVACGIVNQDDRRNNQNLLFSTIHLYGIVLSNNHAIQGKLMEI